MKVFFGKRPQLALTLSPGMTKSASPVSHACHWRRYTMSTQAARVSAAVVSQQSFGRYGAISRFPASPAVAAESDGVVRGRRAAHHH